MSEVTSDTLKSLYEEVEEARVEVKRAKGYVKDLTTRILAASVPYALVRLNSKKYGEGELGADVKVLFKMFDENFIKLIEWINNNKEILDYVGSDSSEKGI